MAEKIIGRITSYTGKEHRHLSNYDVRIVAVLHNAAKPGIDVDGTDYANLGTDEEIEAAGGVTAHDRIEVQPYIGHQRRFSFVTVDPKAVDLACFHHLRK